MRTHRRILAALAVPAVMTLALTACGGDDEADTGGDEPDAATKTAGVTNLNGQWPLTGEKLEGDLPEHPVYVVKIDNTSSSAPQIGLDEADLVVEQLVEGGLTRLAAFYYSDIPDEVGPVRSMRASDIGIVKPTDGTLVASGGAGATIRRLAHTQVNTLTEGATGYYREDSRPAPYNLFMNLTEAADHPGKNWQPPPAPYMSFGDPADFAGDKPAKTIEATFSGGHTTDWEYTDKGWTRPGSNSQEGSDFVADNVLLLEVKVGDAGYKDPAGNPVPETYFSGKGRGVLVHGDQAIAVKWQKKRSGPVSLTTTNGKEVNVPAGQTFIELVPADGGGITIGK